jgi:hypothetical protein
MAAKCPRCGGEVLPGARFCHLCGQALEGPESPAAGEGPGAPFAGGTGAEAGEGIPHGLLAFRVQRFLLEKLAEVADGLGRLHPLRDLSARVEAARELGTLRREILLVNPLEGPRALDRLEALYEERYQALRQRILGRRAWPLVRFFPELRRNGRVQGARDASGPEAREREADRRSWEATRGSPR